MGLNAPSMGTGQPTSADGIPLQTFSDMPSSYTAMPNPTLTQQMSGFLGSDTGQLITSALPLATGLYGAQQANQNLQQLTNQERGVVQPAVNYGQGTLNQMMGGAPMAGPAGQYVGTQMNNANTLAQAAQPYATGNLTQGQALALQQAAQGASASTNLGYAMSGNPLSSANVAAQQGIADQSIITAGQVQQQNIQFAAQAMQAAQGVYSGILNGALQSTQLGLSGYSQAVQQQIQGNQQIQQQMQQLMNGVAQGITGSSPSGPGGTQAGQLFGSTLNKVLGSNQPGAVGGTTQGGSITPAQASQVNYVDTPSPSDYIDTSGFDSGSS